MELLPDFCLLQETIGIANASYTQLARHLFSSVVTHYKRQLAAAGNRDRHEVIRINVVAMFALEFCE